MNMGSCIDIWLAYSWRRFVEFGDGRRTSEKGNDDDVPDNQPGVGQHSDMTIEEKVPGKNAGRMGASAGRRWLFPSRSWTYGVTIDLLLLDLHLWTLILHDCHDNLELDRSVQARQLVSRDLPMGEMGEIYGGVGRRLKSGDLYHLGGAEGRGGVSL